MSKTPLWVTLGILGIILLGVVFYFSFVKQGFFDTADIGLPRTFTTSINGIPLNGLVAWKLGTDTGNACSGTITNSYTEGSTLTLFSSASSCENGIKVEGIFPKGTLKVTCNLYVTSGSGSQATTSWCEAERRITASAQQQTSGNPIEQRITNEIITLNTDNTFVKVWLWEKVPQDSYSENSAIIEFTPDVITQDVPPTSQNTTESQTTQEKTFVEKVIDVFTPDKQENSIDTSQPQPQVEADRTMLYVVIGIIFLIVILTIFIILSIRRR